MSNIKKSCKKIAKYAMTKIGMYSEEALELIMRTGQAESGYKCLRQVGGPAIGFWQMEPNTMFDIMDNYVLYRPQLRTDLQAIGYNDSNPTVVLLGNILLQAALCRVHYRRVPEKLPKLGDIKGQARYWKKYYNTDQGKGTEEKYIDTVREYL